MRRCELALRRAVCDWTSWYRIAERIDGVGPSGLGAGAALVRTPPVRRQARGGRRRRRLLGARKASFCLARLPVSRSQI